MKDGPDIARIAALVGDPARSNMLIALMGGKALTATELAHYAGVTSQTASSHLAKLEDAKILRVQKQGRHRYYELSGPDIAALIESLMGIAERVGHRAVRTGPNEPALRRARVCYDHLAGNYGVTLFDTLRAQNLLAEDLTLTEAGKAFCADFGIDLHDLARTRRPLCKACLDWSVRRTHLAGALGAAFLDRFSALGWAARQPDSRVVRFTTSGEKAFAAKFGQPQTL